MLSKDQDQASTDVPKPSAEVGSMSEAEHKAQMKQLKAAVDQRMQAAQRDAGVLIVLTGDGKGKSSSAFGMAARALGHGMKVGVVQFIKGAIKTGEAKFFARFPDEVEYHTAGEGYTWVTQDRERDIAKAREGWEHARRMLADPAVGLIVLDELNIVLQYAYLEVDEVLAAVRARPPLQHVVITGRGAPQAVIDAGDTVTEVTLVKHAFNQGIRAQKGVEL
ncbi:MAG: cob(I)yrinic acid a,c-diamide adenosyltransferase [Burkholderiales bacterium]